MSDEFPYAGSSGWSGSDASRERAEREDRDGLTSARQRLALSTVASRGAHGLTWTEFAASAGFTQGQATAPLSRLHKAGKIARLTEKRNRCSVYVLPEHVNGRETAAQGRRKASEECTDPACQMVEQMYDELSEKVTKIKALVAPQWRNHMYSRNDLIDDIRKVLDGNAD